MTRYHFVVHHDGPGTSYGISFPDFPGAITAAHAQEHIYDAAKDVLEAHIAFLIREGDPVPEPMPVDDVVAHEDAAGALFIGLVQAGSQPTGRVVRANISMDERLLREIDRAAKARGMTRSAFLADGARRMLA